MTADEQMSENPECVDAAAYVLGALEEDEAHEFEAHLAGCPECRGELSSLSIVADALPLAAPPHSPPRSLKRRVMAGVRAEPQEAQRTRSRSRFGLAPAFPRPAFAAAAGLALALAVAIGALTLGSGAPSTRVIEAAVGWHGSGQLRVSGNHGELIVRQMPQPPRGKVYQVWLKRGSRAPAPTSALFDVTAGGAGAVDVPGDLHGVSAVMVTPEPQGGSSAPTHAPVLVAQL